MRRAVVAMLAMAIAMAVVAIGADPVAAGTTTTTTPSTKSASTKTARAVAKAGVLVRADLPPAWTQQRRTSVSDDERDAAAAEIGDCEPYLAFSRANRRNPRATSPGFDLGEGHVANTVSVYPSAERATAAMRSFADSRLPSCLDRLFAVVFRRQLAERPKLARRLRSVSTDIQRVVGVRIGDEVVVYQGTVDLELGRRRTRTLGLGVLAVRVGDAVAGFSYRSDTDISAALQPAIVASVQRLQQVQSAT